MLDDEVKILTSTLEDILKSEDIYCGLSGVISDELIIRLPSEFKNQLSTVYKNRPLIVETIINALEVLYNDRNGISSKGIEQYSTLLTGLTTEKVPQPDNSGRPITTIKENDGDKYNTINVNREVHKDIKDTISCLSNDYKYVKPTKILKIKNWLYRNLTPIRKQEHDLFLVMSHQAKDSVLTPEQYYSTINDEVRTKFRKDVTTRVVSRHNTNLRSILDLIGADTIPLETKKRWFNDNGGKYNLIVDVLYRTFVPTNKQIKTLMTEMANEADKLYVTPMCDSVIGEYIDIVQRTKLPKDFPKVMMSWMNGGQGLLWNSYNSMLNNGMLNRYKPQVKDRVIYFLTKEM
jgi:hypothetical protein